MSLDTEHQIRERAYHLWVAEGCQDGYSERHWLVAEREVLAAFAAEMPAPKARASGRTAKPRAALEAKAPAKARRRAS